MINICCSKTVIIEINVSAPRMKTNINMATAFVTGKSQTGLHVGSVCFTLTSAFRCFCALKGYCLYIMACLGKPCPSAWMLNQSAFVQGNIGTLFHLWMATRKKKLTHSFPEAGHSRWYLSLIASEKWPFCVSFRNIRILFPGNRHCVWPLGQC